MAYKFNPFTGNFDDFNGPNGEFTSIDVDGDITIGGTGRVSFPLGLAATPSLYPDTDTNTGIYSPGADQLAVATNGTGRLFVDASGNVGLGTSSPQSILNLSSTGPVITLTRNNSADTGSGAINFASSDNTVRWQVGTNQAVGAGLEINRGAGTNNAVYIDTSNRVGIGTTAPNRKLEVSDAGADNFIRVNTTGATKSGIEFASSGTAYSQLYFTNVSPYDLSLLQQYTTGSLILGTNSTEKARLTSSGQLLVGTSTSVSNAYVGGNAHQQTVQAVTATNSYANGLAAINYSASAFAPVISLGLSKSNSLGTNTAVGSGDQLGIINFVGNDGTNFRSGAYVLAEVDGGVSTGDLPTRLVFSTTADGASSPTERMRITNSGQVLISCTSFPSATVKGVGWANNSGVGFFYASAVSLTSSVEHAEFINPNGVVGSISTNASATAYNTSSDYRLKENIEPVTDGITRLQKLKPSRFNFIADPDTTFDGFIAHEAQAVVPECVTGEKDAVDDDGNPKHQGIDQSKLVPLLTAALQEAIAKIETLEQRLTAAGID